MSSNRLYGPTPAPGAAGTIGLNTQGGIAAVLPATQTLLTTAEAVIVNPSLPTVPLQVNIPQNSPLEGKPFLLVGSGVLNFGTSSTATLKVYSGTSLTPGSNTQLATSGAITGFAGKVPFNFELKLQFDSISGKLNGSFKFMVNNTLVAEAALSNVVTGLNNNPSIVSAPPVSVASFCLSLTCGTGGTQVIVVDEFAINF